jgi:hypothetical protein
MHNHTFSDTRDKSSLIHKQQNARHHDFDVRLQISEACHANFIGAYDDGQTPDLKTRPLLRQQPVLGSGTLEFSGEDLWSIVCR